MKRLVTIAAILLVVSLATVVGAIANTSGTGLARTGDYIVGATHTRAFAGTLIGVRTAQRSHRAYVIVRGRDSSIERIPMDQITRIGR